MDNDLPTVILTNNFTNPNVVKVTWPMFIASLITSVTLTPIVLLVLCLFALYRATVYVILKIRFGSRFAGLIGGADVAHFLEDTNKGVINILFLMEHEPESYVKQLPKYIGSVVHKTFLADPHVMAKHNSIYSKFMGYSYRLSTTVTLEECCRNMRVVKGKGSGISKEEFYALLGDVYSEPLPRNQTVLWEILAGYEYLNWINATGSKKLFPIVARSHHVIADGASLLKLTVARLGDPVQLRAGPVQSDSTETILPTVNRPAPAVESRKRARFGLLGMVRCFLVGLYVWTSFPATLFVQLALKARDNNVLHGPKLSGKLTMAFSVESGMKYVDRIKRIKKALPGSTFSEVVFTAFSASLQDLYLEKTSKCPDYVCATVPLLRESLELRNLVSGQTPRGGLKCKNTFSIVLMKLPLSLPEASGRSLIERYKWVKEETKVARKSVDRYVNYLMLSMVCPLIPECLLVGMQRMMHCTTFMSIIAGPQSIYADEILLKHLVFWVPFNEKIGTAFATLSYGGRLHVMFSADKALITDQGEVQRVVDGVFKYLDLFEEEIESGF